MADNGDDGRDPDDGGNDADQPRESRPDRSDESTSGRSDDDRVGKASLSLDATLELLANRDRRAILSYLMDAPDGTATVNELVEHLLDRKTERTGERPGPDHVATTLHHVHVPKLADAGVVDYDARSREIRYWGSDRLEAWHERIRRETDG